jgi:hypothetical protein
MNHNLRDRMAAEAASLADRYPADIEQATASGTRRLRRRYILLSATAVLVVAVLSVCVLLWRSASGAPAWGPFAPAASASAEPTTTGDTAPVVVGLRIEPAEASLAARSSGHLAAFLILDNGASVSADQVQLHWTVEWASSDPSIATVDQDGVVHALRPGSITVRAVAAEPGGIAFTATSRVTVGRVP